MELYPYRVYTNNDSTSHQPEILETNTRKYKVLDTKLKFQKICH